MQQWFAPLSYTGSIQLPMGDVTRLAYDDSISKRKHHVTLASISKYQENGFRGARHGGAGAYWSPDALSSFTLLMSGHGVPVCASMMLGDPVYARDHLRLACTFDDAMLQQVAVEMMNTPAYRPAMDLPAQQIH